MTTPAPSFTQKWEASNIVEHAGSNQFSVQVGCDGAPEYSRLPAVAYGRTKKEAKERAALVAASPSLYAYAKAEEMLERWHTELMQPADFWEQIQAHFASMGWDGNLPKRAFLNTYRAAALAQAEGRNP